MEQRVRVEGISKSFFSKQGENQVLLDISFDVYDGEFLVILGAGQCGKSVLLNILGGLVKPDAGNIYIDGKKLEGVSEKISMVFQKLAIMPFKTVMENVELGLKFSHQDKWIRREIVKKYIDLVGLSGFENSYPSQLSGGMKQRVGIARAYATNPDILIMDEPFGQLDAQTRYAMQNEIIRVANEEKKTIIFVTNNIEEACFLGDRIILLGNMPASVKKEYDLGAYTKPRDITSEQFLNLRKEISSNTDLSL